MTEQEAQYTGSFVTGGLREEVRKKTYTFGPYTIMVRVTEDGKLVDIVEVRVNKEFLTVKQKIESSAPYDVIDLYET